MKLTLSYHTHCLDTYLLVEIEFTVLPTRKQRVDYHSLRVTVT